VPGVEATDPSDPATIAKTTVQTLDRCLPPAMPGVTFLSGGISEEDSSIYLNEINKLDKKGAFATTFSYSRALQSSCIKIWGGKEENYKKAQDQLLARAQANSEASLGKYEYGSQPSMQEAERKVSRLRKRLREILKIQEKVNEASKDSGESSLDLDPLQLQKLKRQEETEEELRLADLARRRENAIGEREKKRDQGELAKVKEWKEQQDKKHLELEAAKMQKRLQEKEQAQRQQEESFEKTKQWQALEAKRVQSQENKEQDRSKREQNRREVMAGKSGYN